MKEAKVLFGDILPFCQTNKESQRMSISLCANTVTKWWQRSQVACPTWRSIRTDTLAFIMNFNKFVNLRFQTYYQHYRGWRPTLMLALLLVAITRSQGLTADVMLIIKDNIKKEIDQAWPSITLMESVSILSLHFSVTDFFRYSCWEYNISTV